MPTSNDLEPLETGRPLITEIDADLEMGKDLELFKLNTPPKKKEIGNVQRRVAARQNSIVPLNLNITIPPLSQT